MENLVRYNWHINNKCAFIVVVVGASILIRVILSLFSAAHLWYIYDTTFWNGFCGAFRGFIRPAVGSECEKQQLRKRSDFLSPFFLGLLELIAFPILIATGALTVIGAWIGFKAIAQWGTWKEERFTFNRFLLGNALVVAVSYWLAWEFVTCSAK